MPSLRAQADDDTPLDPAWLRAGPFAGGKGMMATTVGPEFVRVQWQPMPTGGWLVVDDKHHRHLTTRFHARALWFVLTGIPPTF